MNYHVQIYNKSCGAFHKGDIQTISGAEYKAINASSDKRAVIIIPGKTLRLKYTTKSDMMQAVLDGERLQKRVI